MSDSEYICWGDDREDLTDKVKELIGPRPNIPISMSIPVAGVGGNLKQKITKVFNNFKKKTLRISVECSKGHKNIFNIKV